MEIERQESDTALFLSLLYHGEQVLKLVGAGLAAAVQNDRDRHRYRCLHRLVRADGLGDWAATIEDILTGPPSQFLAPAARLEQKELTQRTVEADWQHRATSLLWRCLNLVDPEVEPLLGRIDGRRWLRLFVELRNRTRGHGAPKPSTLARLCPALEESIDQFVSNYRLFRRPWAYLHRNLSRKYRVTKLTPGDGPFDYLKSDRSQDLENGVYVHLDSHARVALLFSDADASDFFLPNGRFSDKSFELISYASDRTETADSGPYLAAAADLPVSATQGLGTLDVQGNTFGNLPPASPDYVPRAVLEEELFTRLIDDRHPVVTVRGAGGIGKTSVALRVLHRIASEGHFGAIIWFSARDIDLLAEGPKDVRPQVLTEDEIAWEFCELMRPEGYPGKGFKPERYLAESLTRSPIEERVLYAFDNFETVRSPGGLYAWIDTYIRPPNKVFITTRLSDFKGDYPIEVFGMSEGEAEQLSNETARKLGIHRLLTPEYRRDLYRESDGHPYVIKILLGEAAKAGRPQKVQRIMSGRDDILDALFERTFAGISPGARQLFMMLSRWRSTVPELAVEAVTLTRTGERFDVQECLDELKRSSLVEARHSDEGDAFLTVPLVAAIFGQRKLKVSADRLKIEANTEILQFFGAAQRTDIGRGIAPRIQRMFAEISEQVSRNPERLLEFVPIMEFVARKHLPAWLLLARLYEETEAEERLEKAKGAVKRYLERAEGPEERLAGWRKVAAYCRLTDDWEGEILAHVALSELPCVNMPTISDSANRVNGILVDHYLGDGDERDLLVSRLANAMESRLDDASGTDCSRLAWLYLRLRKVDRARELVERGLRLEPSNGYCQNLRAKLN